jgi:hypothetical protein
VSVFGVRCDAITKSGKRCKCKTQWEVPCVAVYDARCNSYRADTFRPVRLCVRHHSEEWRLKERGQRLKLHHGGWLGAYNQHRFGSIVTDRPAINWDKPRLRVPKYWQKEENLTP